MDISTLPPPYQFECVQGIVSKMGGQDAPVNRGKVIEAWMKAGANGKDMRNSALAHYGRTGQLLVDDTTVLLPGGEGEKKLNPKMAGALFLARKSDEEGVHKLPSGLLFKYLKKGQGAKSPTENDPCEVHYHGTLTSGKVFDSSVNRNKPSNFAPSQVIASWKEMLQLMREGDKVEIYSPSELAYGARGSPPSIPGFSCLVFTIELLKVVAGGKPASDADAMLTKLLGKPAAEL